MKVEFIDPGRFRVEMRLMTPAPSADGMGGVIEAWTEAATLFARVEPTRSRSTPGAGQTIQTTTHRITMRARSDVHAGMRLVRGGRVFHVAAAHDPDETGRYLIVEAEEVIP